MQRILILGATALVVLGLGVPRLKGIHDRLEDLEQRTAQTPGRERVLRARLETLTDRLMHLARTRKAQLAAQGAQRARMRKQLGELEAEVAAAHERLAALDRADEERSAKTETRLAALEGELKSDWAGLRSAVEAAASLADETRNELDHLAEADEQERWRAMLGPTVQLAGISTVGSGVLLTSRQLEGGDYQTLILTAWHVARDIRSDSLDGDGPIPVTIYAEDGSQRHESSRLLAQNADIDLALLLLDRTDAVPFGARLATPREIAEARVFEPVVAVGCPLGNDPIPTEGEVADTLHQVDGADYWMINAPAYIGNSGGPVFDSHSHHVLGIFSKIYTHGSLRPTIVPHMGLVTPMDKLYGWLEELDQVKVIPTADGCELEWDVAE